VNRRRGPKPTRNAALFYDAVIDKPGAATGIDARSHWSSPAVPRHRRRRHHPPTPKIKGTAIELVADTFLSDSIPDGPPHVTGRVRV